MGRYQSTTASHFEEPDDFSEDVQSICQAIYANGYMPSCGSVFEGRFDHRETVAPRYTRTINQTACATPKLKPKRKPLPVLVAPKPVVDFAAYKAQRLVEQQEAEHAAKQAAEKLEIALAKKIADDALAERAAFVTREMFLNQYLPGRKWAQAQIKQLLPHIRQLKKIGETWQAEQFKGRVNQLRKEYQISA